MKGYWEGLPGKVIEAVLVRDAEEQPRGQVVIVFTDGTYFEFYSGSGDLRGTNNVYTGSLEEVVRIYGESGDYQLFEAEY